MTTAIAEAHPTDAADRARTLISASIGIKNQVETREQYAKAVEVALDLIVGREPNVDARHRP